MAIHGNAIVGQSGGPTAAINASLAGVIRGAAAAHAEGRIEKLYGMKNGIEGFAAGHYTDLSSLFGDDASLALLERTPSSALGSCRLKLPEPSVDDELYKTLLARLKELDVRFFFYIGGNDSMDTVAKLSRYCAMVDYDMKVVGVPKTIDNDLCETDHTPGFGSAAKYIANTMAELDRDCAVYDMPAVTVVEIMGRDTGWLTSAAGIADLAGGNAPDLLYFPERNFTPEQFYADAERAFAKRKNLLVAISEGIHAPDGSLVGEAKSAVSVDSFGHKSLTGACKEVAAMAKNHFGCKARGIELSLIQRCGAHIGSLTDITEASGCGAFAVRLALDGHTGVTVVMHRTSDDPYEIRYEYADVRLIANRIKYLPDAFIAADNTSITAACRRYLVPLIQGETNPPYLNGVVRHFSI